MPTVRRLFAVASLAAAATLVAPARSPIAAQGIPARYTDQDYWKFIVDVSEPGGYFRSDNFLSNETGYQMVIPELKRETKAGGVYLGVGPEQNFTYIVAMQPKVAIIFDIRRQNMILHLMYKALMEMSPDRADFLSRLFSRPRPPGLDTTSTPGTMFQAYEVAPRDPAAYRQNLAAIKDWLVNKHGLALGDSDMASLDYVFSAFYGGGPEINYSYTPGGAGGGGSMGYGGGRGRGGMPSYAQLQSDWTDGAGHNLAYLATEANYRWLKEFETKNLLIPVVGNFAGPKAIRAVAQYLKDRGVTVTAFYLSNVEQYLFMQGDDWSNFYKNVLTLPVDSGSTFIRSNGGGGRGGGGCAGFASGGMGFIGRGGGGGMQGPNLLASILLQRNAFREGRLTTYCDVLSTSHY